MNYQILVVDDHPIVTEGICRLLERQTNVTCNGINIMDNITETIFKSNAQLYILDLSLPDVNGFRVLEQLLCERPNSKILVYTMHEEPWIIEQLSRYPIHGAVSKNAPLTELLDAVKRIRDGGNYFSSGFAQFYYGKNSDEADTKPTPVLSKREKEVLHNITLGKSTNEIAEELYLSINTIHTYRKRLMAKLNAKNMAELVYKGKDFF